MLKAGLRQTSPGASPDGNPTSLTTAGMTEPQRKIVQALSGPSSLDQLVAWTGLPIQRVQSELTMLEVRGVVRRQGGLFSRRKGYGRGDL